MCNLDAVVNLKRGAFGIAAIWSMQLPMKDSIVRDRRARIIRIETRELLAIVLALLMLDVVCLAPLALLLGTARL
jgi:hypothetical protein